MDELELEAQALELEAEALELEQGLSLNPQSESGVSDYLMGASKGYLKGLPQVVTRPLDLVVRGGNALAESLGAEQVDLTGNYPTDLWKRGVDWLAGGTPSNQTTEQISEVVGTLPGLLASPSAIGPAMQATKGMSVLPRTLAVGTAAIPEGAFWGASFGASDTSTPLSESATTGAVTNALTAGAGPVVSEIASDLAGPLNRAKESFAQSSIGARVRDFKNSRKRTGAWEGDSGALETRLSEAINEETGHGTFPAFRNPAKTESAVTQTREAFGKEIGGITQELDLVGARPNLNLSKAEKLVNDAPFNLREDMQAQLEAFKKTLDYWDGSAASLHQARSSVGQTAYSSSATGMTAKPLSQKMQRALYEDMTNALNGAMEEAILKGNIPPERAMQLANANRRYGNLKEVQDIVADSALSNQHAQIPLWQRLFHTTGGMGVPMAMGGYYYDGMKGAAAAYVAGLTLRSRAGQAFLSNVMRGGANGMSLLSEAANNPYMVRGMALAAMPRDWDVVKDDPAARETIAIKMGMAPEQFNTLPEPMQKEFHKQVVMLDPESAEPVQGNLNIINGQFQDPFERDWVIQNALDKSPEERANIIGNAFQNKYVGPMAMPQAPTPQYPIDLDMVLNSFNNTYEPMDNSQDMNDMVSQLERATRVHAQDF